MQCGTSRTGPKGGCCSYSPFVCPLEVPTSRAGPTTATPPVCSTPGPAPPPAAAGWTFGVRVTRERTVPGRWLGGLIGLVGALAGARVADLGARLPRVRAHGRNGHGRNDVRNPGGRLGTVLRARAEVRLRGDGGRRLRRSAGIARLERAAGAEQDSENSERDALHFRSPPKILLRARTASRAATGAGVSCREAPPPGDVPLRLRQRARDAVALDLTLHVRKRSRAPRGPASRRPPWRSLRSLGNGPSPGSDSSSPTESFARVARSPEAAAEAGVARERLA